MYERNSLHWDGLTLRFGKSGRVVASVIPDPDWQRIYRVQIPGKPLSDMVNLTRAKDAAVWLALAALNERVAA